MFNENILAKYMLIKNSYKSTSYKNPKDISKCPPPSIGITFGVLAESIAKFS